MIKIKISESLKFWNLKHQFHLYLDQVSKTGNYKRFKLFSLTIIFLFVLQMTIFVLIPLNYFQRLLLSDPCLFLHLPQQQNWIFLFFSVESVVFHMQMYRPANKALQLIRTVMRNDDDQLVNQFFIMPAVPHKGRLKMSLDIVRDYTQKYLYGIWYFVTFESKKFVK